jgi:undecaprenyl diphosphate synthase
MPKKVIDFQELFGTRVFNTKIVEKEFPQHVTVSTSSFKTWAAQTGSEIGKAVEKHKLLLKDLIDWQIENDLPILTISLGQQMDEYKLYLGSFLDTIDANEFIHKNQIRVFIVGKWYDLDAKTVDSIKNIMNKTKDYDKYFLNLCVNYDGQDEILSALKLLTRKIEGEKINVDDISKSVLKENLFTSYFLPPQVMIETGHTFSGVLLWECQGAVIHFTRKPWFEFEKRELEIAIEKYQRVKLSEKNLQQQIAV